MPFILKFYNLIQWKILRQLVSKILLILIFFFFFLKRLIYKLLRLIIR